MTTRLAVLILCGGILVTAVRAGEPHPGLRAGKGFRVELFADDQLAHDIFSMTIDSAGRVVVAGKDYVKILHDDDRDGRADRATVFAKVPKSGAHGMCFDGNDLICTGDNAVQRFRDLDGDGQADGAPEIWAALKHPEHGANGVFRGPDGWFYVACGNDAGVDETLASTATSPVSRPECGAIVRFSPDGRRSEIVAHGFRNIYDADFNSSGHLFTVDSDGERDQYLPWYAPTRLFDVAIGQHHGWVLRGWQHSWNRPERFFDSQPRLAEIGRGSPTGVVTYRHRQFPRAYRDAVFSCCWTLGRVYAFPLRAVGGSYETSREIFLETTGEVGFAPVDIAVGPDGDLFVAIGGRQTRGSVFKVSYVGEPDAPVRESSTREGDLLKVLRADQPTAAWSRARWLPVANQLGRESFRTAARDSSLDSAARQRALEVLAELWDGVSAELAESLLTGEDDAVGARAVSLLARATANEQAIAILTKATRPTVTARIRRAAWETTGRIDRLAVGKSSLVQTALAEPHDQRLRTLALWAVRDCDLPAEAAARTTHERLARRRLEIARGNAAPPNAKMLGLLAATIRQGVTLEERLEAVRLAQLELGDVRSEPTDPPVYAGYVANHPERIVAGESRDAFVRDLIRALPEPNRDVDARPASDLIVAYELVRLLGMLQPDNATLLDKFPALLQSLDSQRVEDVLHYLIVLSRLPGTRREALTRATADQLVALHATMAKNSQFPSRNWPTRVVELFEQLRQRDPNLARVLIASPTFGHPEHSLFALQLPVEDRPAAARRMIEHDKNHAEDQAWTVGVVEMLGTLPADESLPLVRLHWGDFMLRDSIANLLARHARPDDRQRLVESLGSLQPAVVELVANALRKIGGRGQDREISEALHALRQASLVKEFGSTRVALHQLLNTWTGAKIVPPAEAKDPAELQRLWTQWIQAERPGLAREIETPRGVDAAAWTKRLAAIDWTKGQVEPGKTAFEKRACARCHRAADRLGPELAGAAGRFSPQDLFVAIIDPSRDVAPLYQTSQVITRSGKVYQGLIVYESPESTLVQTTPDDTVRVTGDEIVGIRKSRQSLMPVGLLNNADDGELADLYAYLKTLRGR